jgi:catechol 2,3-dioxygenase-like lactoylglutathione lyase family enzyme
MPSTTSSGHSGVPESAGHSVGRRAWRPAVFGLSHLSLSVVDVRAARDFWVEVLDFDLVSEEPAYCFLLHRAAGLAVVLTDHGATVAGTFDEHHPGLDHVAYAVADVDSLRAWEEELTLRGVPHAAVVETDAGHHLNLRAPDDLPIELYVMKPGFAAQLGLDDGVPPVAVTR